MTYSVIIWTINEIPALFTIGYYTATINLFRVVLTGHGHPLHPPSKTASDQ